MEAVNLKEKLTNVRETCRGYSEYTYRFVDYVAEHLTDPVSPAELAAAAYVRVREIEDGRDEDGNALPEYFVTNKDEILAVAWQFLQVIDVVTDDEFAEEFRELCEVALGWNALWRFNPTNYIDYYDDGCDENEECPTPVKVAVDWWAGVIQAGQEYTKESGKRRETPYKRLSRYDVQLFRELLGVSVGYRVVQGYWVCLDIFPELEEVYTPLASPLGAIGIHPSDLNMVMPHHSFFANGHVRMVVLEERVYIEQENGEPIYLW